MFVYNRPEALISDQAEEVVLMDFVEGEGRRQRAQREAYNDDDDEGGHGGGRPQGVQCATQ